MWRGATALDVRIQNLSISASGSTDSAALLSLNNLLQLLKVSNVLKKNCVVYTLGGFGSLDVEERLD